jgi:hypothetical protein
MQQSKQLIAQAPKRPSPEAIEIAARMIARELSNKARGRLHPSHRQSEYTLNERNSQNNDNQIQLFFDNGPFESQESSGRKTA